MGRHAGPDLLGPGAVRVASTVAALTLSVGRGALADEPIDVEVRGQPIASPTKEPSVAGSVIREGRLRAPGVEAADVLRTQPGVAVHETGGYGSPSTASIRGATAAETPVYLAGVRLNDDVGGTADLSLVPLWLVHTIEIYRSNAPLAGDELGIGGAVYFEPRRPKRTEVNAGVLAGSFGAHALWADADIGDEDASVLAGVRLDGARNDYSYVNDNGTRNDPSDDHTVRLTNAQTQTVDVWAMGSLRLGAQGRADFVANDVEREEGLPGLRLYPTKRARVSLGRRLGGLTSRLFCADHACEVTMTAAAIVTHARYDDPLREAAFNTTRLDLDATRVDDGLLVKWSLTRRLSVTPSVRASIERLTISPASAAPVRAERTFSRAGLQGEWSLSDGVALRALGTVECNGTSFQGVPPWSLAGGITGPARGTQFCNQVQPAARIGVELGSAPFVLLANVGRYARVPTLAELYGVSGAVRGSTALVPETGVSLEAGMRATASSTGVLRGASVDLFGFVRTSSQLITYVRAAQGYVVPFNIGSARVAGLELLADYSPARFAFLELAATLLDPRNTSPNRPVNDILAYEPRLVLVPRVELCARLRAYPFESGKLSVSYFYESSRYADALTVVPEQGSLDVEAEIGALGDRLSVRGRLANVLDQTRTDLVGYPLPGRAANVALEAKW
jgi:iron complex outermembrane receptor protein